MSSAQSRLLALSSLFFLAALSGFAQNSSSFTGTVRDSTGAVIAGAAVSVTNIATGGVLKATTNSTGDYLVAGIPAGKYNLEISSQGFKKYEATSIDIAVNQKARVDANLEVGDIATAVSVEGTSVAQVETQSSEFFPTGDSCAGRQQSDRRG